MDHFTLPFYIIHKDFLNLSFGVFLESSFEGIFRFVSWREDINAFPRDSIFPFNGDQWMVLWGLLSWKRGGGDFFSFKAYIHPNGLAGVLMNAFVFGGVANSYLGYLFPTRATNIIIIMLMGLMWKVRFPFIMLIA